MFSSSSISLPSEYWADVYSSAIFTINRFPSTTTSNKSPYDLLFERTSVYTLLHTIRCLCFPITPNSQRTKLQNVSTRCVFIGYSFTHKGYKCKDLSTGKITVSRHVLFDKNTFPFQHTTTINPKRRTDTATFPTIVTKLLPSPTRLCMTWADNPQQSENYWQSSSVHVPTN